MKQELNPTKKTMEKVLVFSIIIVFSFKSANAQLSPKLTSFSIEMQNKNILKLSWSVEQQKNNIEYIIQRSSDLKNWNVVGEIKSISGENTAAYSFNDKKLNEGMNYYRIQQIDIYGNIRYSVLKVFDNSVKSMMYEWASVAQKKAK